MLRLLAEVAEAPLGLRALEALVRALEQVVPQKKEKLMVSMAEKWKRQGIEEGKRQGIEEGIEVGKRQGSATTARDDLLEVLEARFGTLPPRTLKRIRGLGKVDTLRALLREAATAESLEAFQRTLERTAKG